MPVPTPPEGLSVPLTFNTDGFAIDTIQSDGLGQVFAQIRGGPLVALGGAVAPVFPAFQIVFGTGAAIGASPLFQYDPGTGQLTINGTPGIAGEVLTSAGPGLPAAFAPFPPFPTLPINEILIGSGAPGYITSPLFQYDLATGTFTVGGAVGILGDVLTSGGPGLPAVWVAPTPPTVLPTVALRAIVVGTGAPGYVASANLAQGAAGEITIAGAPGTAGQVITSAGAGAPPVWSTPVGTGGAILTWGAENINSTADTRVMPPGFDTASLNTNTPKGYMAPRAGTFRNMFARHNTAVGNGNSVNYRLRVNGVLTALQVTLATGAVGSTSDLVNTVAVAQGALIEVVRINALAIGSGILDAMVSAEFL